MARFVWQDGTLVSKAKVEVGGTIYEVDPEEYSGTTPLSANNLNAMEDDIYENINALQNAIKWKTAGTATGSNQVNLPAEFDELLIIVHGGSSATTHFTFSIPYLALSSNEIGFTDGQYADAVASSRVRIYVSNSIAYLSMFTVDNVDVLSSSTITVYYK